ncbi:MAG: HD domain-containing protein, partial [Schleiferiaceae bacterium]|nr:HD domain-containing protein [Schleiferiaceae bacterium]
MISSELVQKSANFVFVYYKEKANPHLIFHNYKHTCDVVDGVNEIADALHLDDADRNILQVAAWFHDTGYLERKENHEELSATAAEQWLKEQKVDEKDIEKVVQCIKATNTMVEPDGVLPEILKDADTLNIGTAEYKQRSNLLRLENFFLTNQEVDDKIWVAAELEFLKNHKYYTSYAQKTYNDGKGKNIISRSEDLKKAEKKKSDADKKLVKAKPKTEEAPGRTVETMFRTTLRNHVNLSAIADNKANLMLSINAIIISITVTVLVPNFSNILDLIIPTTFLLCVCLT